MFRLRPKLTLTLFLVSFGALVTILAIVVSLQNDYLESKAREFRRGVAEQARIYMQRFMDEAKTEINFLGQALLPKEGRSAQDHENDLKERLGSTRLVRYVSVYHPKGALISTLGVEGVPLPLPSPKTIDPESLDQATRQDLSSYRIVWKEQKTSAGKILKTPYLPLLTPIQMREKKEPFLYLRTLLPLQPFQEATQNISFRNFGERTRIYLLDYQYRIIAHPDEAKLGSLAPEAIRQTSATFNKDNPMAAEIRIGREAFFAEIVAHTTFAWGIIVQQPAGEVYALSERVWRIALLSGGVLALLLLLIGIFFGGRLATPILQVADAAGKVASGAFETRVAVKRGDEIGEMATAFNTMAHDLQAYRQKVVDETRIRTDISRYLSSDLVEQIVRGEASLALGGERKTITVMFADIVAFTPLAERTSPEKVVALLNEVFTIMTEIIFRHGGTVDKFIGDCAMAVFGAPYTKEDDGLRAVRAAEEIMRWLEAGNVRWKKEIGSDLQIGIGINTGEAIVGNIGSQRRMEYTVIGDTVNVAAHLESFARPGQILLSKATSEAALEEFEVESLGFHQLLGKSDEIEIFLLVS